MAQRATQTRWPLNGIVLSIKAQLTTLSETHEGSLFCTKCNEISMGRAAFSCFFFPWCLRGFYSGPDIFFTR